MQTNGLRVTIEGPQGSGKTVLAYLIREKVLNRGNLVLPGTDVGDAYIGTPVTIIEKQTPRSGDIGDIGGN
jgi:polynucleotide 5'-kinase involved in rRNA processing